MITRRAVLFSLVFIAACRGESDAAVDPVWGKQPCDHCKMIVSQKTSAAQLVARGERHHFDDIGCMVQWLDEQHVGRDETRAWVRLGDGWVEATSAHYIGGTSTPMDHGYVASKSGEIDWVELQRRVLAKKELP
jgi:copper chaperone NosL